MDAIRLTDLELAEIWQDVNENMRVEVNFPYTPSFPATTGLDADSLSVVYSVLDPQREVGTHTEDVDELFVLLQGTTEVSIGEEQAELSAGDVTLIPASEPHRIRNVGEESVRFLGVFPNADVTTEFESPIEPLGTRVARTGGT